MIQITADSTCDLPADIVSAMNIIIIPLHVVVNNDVYNDGVDILSADIFRYVDEDDADCKTAALNVYEYQLFFDELSKIHESVIHVSIGSHFSSCYQNALLAAREYSNIHVVDSRNLSSGSGHVVYDAALMAQNGMKAEDICRRLEEIVNKVESSFIVDRLDYLRRGGRCSGLAALGAGILNIKPRIDVIDGRMVVGKKYRGSFKRCLEKYVMDELYGREDIDCERVFITHSNCSTQTVSHVKQLIGQYTDFHNILETTAGCTISCHCGPNTLGILFKRR